MNKFLTGLAVLLLSPVAVVAGPMEDHDQLWRSLQQAGVTLRVNNPQLCGDNTGGGHYNSLYRTLVICQDGKGTASSDQQVAWTTNDMDTLRHEAHHVLQDCLDGTLGNGQMLPVYTDAEKWKEFVRLMPQEKIDFIIAQYKELGANDQLLYLELEAFAAAHHVGAVNIAKALTQVCAR